MTLKVLSEPAFTGREEELKELEAFLNSALQGKGKTVFISGEAGSGKTRLTREFLNIAKRKRASILAGWCLSDASVPYFPFIEAFNAYFASLTDESLNLQQPGTHLGMTGAFQIRDEEQAVTAWLTGPRPIEKPGRATEFSPQVWKDQAFAFVAKTLHTLSAQTLIILLIEDLQWADSASLALIHYIARTISSERVLVITTLRSEELTADSEGRPRPLAEVMRLMRHEDLFVEIKLSSLTYDSISKIAGSLIGGSLQPKFAEKLATESRGNPLFVVESLRMLTEGRSLVQKGNLWDLAVDKLEIPAKIRDVILRRLAVLKYAQRRVLDAASVIGEKFDTKLLSSILVLDDLEILDTLNFIAQSTSIVLVEGAHYRFDHARSREVLYDVLSSPLRTGYHAKIAEILENSKDRKLADLAYHYAHAENKEKAIEYSLSAGREALTRWSNTEAGRYFTYVLQTVGDNPERFTEKTVALEGSGDALYATNNFNEAAKTFEQLADIQEGVVKLRALRKAMFAAYYQGDLRRLRELTDKAEKNATADRLESARVIHQKARVLGFQGQSAASLALNEQALEVFEEEYALSDAAWSLFVVGDLASTNGQWEKGIASTLRSIALYDELGDFRSQMEAYVFTGLSFAFCRLDQEARENLLKVIEIDNRLKMDNYVQLISAYAFLGGNPHLTTDIEDAISKNLKALEYSQRTDSNLYLGFIYVSLTTAYTYAGDMNRAGQYFEKLMHLPQEILSNVITQGYTALTKAVYNAGKNKFDEADRYFNGFLELIKVHPTNLFAETLHRETYAWCLSKQGRSKEARAQLEEVQRLLDSGLEKFGHVNVVASLMTSTRPIVGETVSLRLDLVNVSRCSGSIVRVENLRVPELKIVDFPSDCAMRDSSVEFKDGTIEPFEVKTIKLTVKAEKLEAFTLNPTVTYINDLGETKTSSTRPFIITVQPAATVLEVQPGRVPAGSKELDALLLGGIPEHYAVALTSPSNDERDLLINRFLEAGTDQNETTIYLTVHPGKVKALAQQQPSNFYLFVCNPRADTIIESLPNVFKFKGVENLTEIDIALAKVFRKLDQSEPAPRRACIDIVSDVLLLHRPINARKWLSGLLADLRSKGFTTLATINPKMHPPEEVEALLGLFEGEISLSERATEEGSERVLRVRKLSGQRYSEKELFLTKEKMMS